MKPPPAKLGIAAVTAVAAVSGAMLALTSGSSEQRHVRTDARQVAPDADVLLKQLDYLDQRLRLLNTALIQRAKQRAKRAPAASRPAPGTAPQPAGHAWQIGDAAEWQAADGRPRGGLVVRIAGGILTIARTHPPPPGRERVKISDRTLRFRAAARGKPTPPPETRPPMAIRPPPFRPAPGTEDPLWSAKRERWRARMRRWLDAELARRAALRSKR